MAIWLLSFGCHTTVDFVYHNYESLQDYLVNVSQTYREITDLYSIGQSIQGETDIFSFLLLTVENVAVFLCKPHSDTIYQILNCYPL